MDHEHLRQQLPDKYKKHEKVEEEKKVEEKEDYNDRNLKNDDDNANDDIKTDEGEISGSLGGNCDVKEETNDHLVKEISELTRAPEPIIELPSIKEPLTTTEIEHIKEIVSVEKVKKDQTSTEYNKDLDKNSGDVVLEAVKEKKTQIINPNTVEPKKENVSNPKVADTNPAPIQQQKDKVFYPREQQIFIGNVKYSLTKEMIKKHLSKYRYFFFNLMY